MFVEQTDLMGVEAVELPQLVYCRYLEFRWHRV
jgi:hypothetical protein